MSKSLGFMYIAKRPCMKVAAMAWEDGMDDAELRDFHARAAGYGGTVERVERFEGEQQPEWICRTGCADCITTDGITAGITDWLDAQGTDEAHRARDLIARQQAKIDRLRKSLRDALEVGSHLMNSNLYNTARELADEPYRIAGAPDAYFEAAEKIAAEQREYRSTEKK